MHDCPINSVTFTADLKYLVTGAADGSILFHELMISVRDSKAYARAPSALLD
jgi:hypothetical protein